MTKSKILSAVFLIFSSVIICCTSSGKTNSTEMLFNKMLETSISAEDELIPLHSINLYKESGNKYYDKIFHSKNTDINFLLKKILSDAETNFCIPNIAVLAEGDIALKLVIEILELNDSYFTDYLVPEEIKNKFEAFENFYWYEWIHRNKENREWIYQQTKKSAAHKLGFNNKHKIIIISKELTKKSRYYGIYTSNENNIFTTTDKNEFIAALESAAKSYPETDIYFYGECAANLSLHNLKQVLKKSDIIEYVSDKSDFGCDLIYLKSKSGTRFKIICLQEDCVCTCPGN